jgi:hypothetical protein
VVATIQSRADIACMHTVRHATPVWVKALLAAVIVGAPSWWLVERHDRIGNEHRLGAVASAIAGQDVRVRCPGVIGRALSWDIVEGSVRFDAAGRPADETKLRAFTCDELDALAEGRRADALACAERSGAACGTEVEELALAVDVLAHESWHLAGVIDEAVTECRAVQTIAWTARQLGATELQGRALARAYLETGYPRLPERYRSGACADGGELDLRPGDGAWP